MQSESFQQGRVPTTFVPQALRDRRDDILPLVEGVLKNLGWSPMIRRHLESYSKECFTSCSPAV